jgi:hypothetical protein
MFFLLSKKAYYDASLRRPNKYKETRNEDALASTKICTPRQVACAR